MGGKLPGAFLTDSENAVDDIVYKPPAALDAFCRYEGIQPIPSCKIKLLIIRPVSGSLKGHKVGGRQGRIGEAQIFFSHGDQFPAQPDRKSFVFFPLAGLGKRVKGLQKA